VERDVFLKPYRGTVERPPPLLELHAPYPWAATIAVTALKLAGYDGARFEVATSWLGPPLPGAPPALAPVNGNDAIILDSEELARRVAKRAKNALSRGELPDLWVLSGQVRRPPGS
jgi:hypothetical protein